MPYPSDLNESEWELIKHHFEFGKYGNRSKYPKLTLLNALFYIVKTGCQWRYLPKEYPNWKTVYSFFGRIKKKGIWEKMMQDLVKISRIKTGRNENPSYSIIDSQSVKTTSSAENKGIDGGGKK